MEDINYKLEIKPYVKQDGVKYKVIKVTDFTFHTSAKRPAISFVEKIKEMFKFKKPARIYGPITYQDTPDPNKRNLFTLNFLNQDPDFIKMVKEEENNGYKILIELPAEGVPILAGEDTKEFASSIRGKRILRRLAKEK